MKQDTSRIAMDLVGDSAQLIHKLRQGKRKWDPVKKNYVAVTDDVKMVRSESGGLIRASYKTDRYKRWKDRNKISDDADDEEKISSKLKTQCARCHVRRILSSVVSS